MPGSSKSPNAELGAKSHFSICHTEEQGASSAVSSFKLQSLRSGQPDGSCFKGEAARTLMVMAGRNSAGPQPQERIHLCESEGGEHNGELENATEKNTAEATTVLHLDVLQN